VSNAKDGYKGKGSTVEKAAAQAWKNAKAKGAKPGKYAVSIEVETVNPIRTYIVTLETPGG
jgi:hypothetical protein